MVLVLAVLVFFLFPPLWILASSLKPPLQIFQWPPALLPDPPTLKNYLGALHAARFDIFFGNTTLVAIASTALCVLISIMAGFSVAKDPFPGHRPAFALVIAAPMIPLQVILIPLLLVFKNLGLIDSLLGIIIPP